MILTLYDNFRKWSEKGSIYLYSDPHFADMDMIYLRKPYVADDIQIYRINKAVHKNDTLIILGDVGDETYLSRLGNFYKILVLGNHDKGKSVYLPYVNEVYEGPLFISDRLLLSHEPIKLDFAFNIHGHDHSNWKSDADWKNHLNVCAEHIGYTPVHLGNLIKQGILHDVPTIHRLAIPQTGDSNE